MIILFTMAGESRRFKMSGYKKKKFMLNAGNKSLFYRAVQPFLTYKNLINKFVFVILESDNCVEWLENELSEISLENYEIITLPHLTCGQAETAFLALNEMENVNNEQLFIMNIDTIIHEPQIEKMQDQMSVASGSIEVATLPGSNWSFVLPDPGNNYSVMSFHEKVKISNLASTGLYGFKNVELLKKCVNFILTEKLLTKEFYISEVFKFLLDMEKIVYYVVNEEPISLSGTPDEYKFYCRENDWSPDDPRN